MATDEYNSLEDLVFSRSFRNWVLRENAPESAFWTDWQSRNPGKLELINQAKAIIYALQLHLKPLPEEAISAEISKVLWKLQEGRINLPEETPFRRRRSRRPNRYWSIAATIAGLGILVWSLRSYLHHQQDSFHSFLAANTAAKMNQQTGVKENTRMLTLPDGSTVRLDPGSRLYYPENLATANNHREVFLEGGAFFDVTRNATHPFYVYTKNITTKVLGTSFRVTASDDGGHTTVAVSSGKVSVYRKNDPSAGILLMPNQQIVYDPSNDKLDRSITDQPKELATDSSLLFDKTPISIVFRRLQDIYGIPILYDEETVAGCSLSVTMGSEPFFEKLSVICKAIDASYESIDGTIVITAHGCKP